MSTAELRSGCIVIIVLVAAAAGMWCPTVAALDSELGLSQYSQRLWTRTDGLPQSTVQALAQTSDGYLWVGTEQGLVRFDGVRFVPAPLRAHDGRVDAWIGVLYADGDDLWAGTSGGLYRSNGDELVEVLGVDGASIGEVFSIYRVDSEQMWIGGEAGLFRLHGDRVEPFVDGEGTELRAVRSIVDSEVAGLCVAEGFVYCLSEGVFRPLRLLNEAIGVDGTGLLASGKDGDLWVATTGKGLVRYDGTTLRQWGVAEGLRHGFVRSLLVDRDGSIWFGSGAAGLGRLGARGLELFSVSQGLAGVEAIALLEDREGNLWIGTAGEGLFRFSETLFVSIGEEEGLRERSVRTVFEDSKGTVWIGTAGGGLYSLADGHLRSYGAEDGLPAADIMSLTEDSQGRLWVGTGGTGIFVLEAGRFVRGPGNARVVFALHEDAEGRMWVGRLGKVVRAEGGVSRAIEGLESVNAAAITSRAGSELLFADGRGGVVVWRDGEVTSLGKEEGFPENITLALHVDSDGGLWVGAHLAGLTYAEGDRVFRFTTNHGLCDDSVFSILEDDGGRLWMSSNLGVFVVEMDQLRAVVRGEAERVECRLFGVEDGMRSAECNGGQSPSAWKDHAGRLWFPTTDGVVRVDPRDLDQVLAPRVVIEEMSSGESLIDFDGLGNEIVLRPDQRDLSIRYTAMRLTDPERTRFRYRLEGLDEDWVLAGARRTAYYTNLPPKRFRFRVQAMQPGGTWSESGVGIDVVLEPRFFETLWFLALMVLAVGGLATFAYRFRVGALRRRQRQLQAIVDERTRELEEINRTLEERVAEGVEALRESDRLAAYGQLVAGVAHEVRHPVFALRTAAHLVNQKLGGATGADKELGILTRETERISRLVDDLLELGRPRELEPELCRPGELIAEAAASLEHNPDIGLRIEQSPVEPSLMVLADRPAVIQVLVNLVGNACRHAVGATHVVIGASDAGSSGMVRFTVGDDGAGIPKEDQESIFEPFVSGTGGTGLGLAISSRLIREHSGTIEVESEPGGGAVFSFTLCRSPS